MQGFIKEEIWESLSFEDKKEKACRIYEELFINLNKHDPEILDLSLGIFTFELLLGLIRCIKDEQIRKITIDNPKDTFRLDFPILNNYSDLKQKSPEIIQIDIKQIEQLEEGDIKDVESLSNQIIEWLNYSVKINPFFYYTYSCMVLIFADNNILPVINNPNIFEFLKEIGEINCNENDEEKLNELVTEKIIEKIDNYQELELRCPESNQNYNFKFRISPFIINTITEECFVLVDVELDFEKYKTKYPEKIIENCYKYCSMFPVKLAGININYEIFNKTLNDIFKSENESERIVKEIRKILNSKESLSFEQFKSFILQSGKKATFGVTDLYSNKIFEKTLLSRQTLSTENKPEKCCDLSDVQIKVLKYISEGTAYKEIALELNLSESRIKGIADEIRRELNARTNAEAINIYNNLKEKQT